MSASVCAGAEEDEESEVIAIFTQPGKLGIKFGNRVEGNSGPATILSIDPNSAAGMNSQLRAGC